MSIHRRHGFSMVEVTISTLIVGLMLSGAIRGVSSCSTMRYRVADRARAQQLAADMLSEVLQQTYAAPATPDTIGVTRAGWTCVDDYNGLTETPPLTQAGNTIPDATGLTRNVAIIPIDPISFTATTASANGVKQVTVNVSRGNMVLASASGYRSSAWVEIIPSPADSTSEHPPTASASASPTSGKVNSTSFSFTGSASTDQDGNTLSYTWNFGDGSAATGVAVNHTYTTVGTFTATVTVYDGFGGQGQSAVTITVTN